MQSGKSDSPFKTVIHSNQMGFGSGLGPGGPVLPPTAGPAGPFATHNSSFNTVGSRNQSFRTVVDEAVPGTIVPPHTGGGRSFNDARFHADVLRRASRAGRADVQFCGLSGGLPFFRDVVRLCSSSGHLGTNGKPTVCGGE